MIVSDDRDLVRDIRVKSNEQCKTCFSNAMTRKSHANSETSFIFLPSADTFWGLAMNVFMEM